MKSNKSSKFNRKNLKTAVGILTILICFGMVFNLVVVEQVEAVVITGTGIVIIMGATFIGGLIVGWLTNTGHDSSSPDALVISEENYILVWEDFNEEWNNDYIQANTNLHNYMMMFNLTYLDSVRRAEHDVASYVNLLNWSDVENNMTSLISYKENLTKFIVATLHGYNRIEVSILQHVYDTDAWSYTTPLKYAPYAHHSTGETNYDWTELTDYGYDEPDQQDFQYKVNFGTYPVGFDTGGGESGLPLKTGGYNIGEKFYVTYIYVPNGNFITLKNLDTNDETTYSQGVYDLQGEENEVMDVTIYDYGSTSANENLDRTGVYLFGVPTDFDVLQDTLKTYNTGLLLSSVGESQSLIFEATKYINEVTVEGTEGSSLYIDGILKYDFPHYQTIPIPIDDYVKNITMQQGTLASGRIVSITTEGYIYPDMQGKLKVVTEHAGTAYITDDLPARGRVGLDWMVNSYKSIYDSMIVQAKILWNLYHANGWYSTDDIPSEFLVIPPDIIFDNMDVFGNLPLDEAQAIYYAWMAQLIDFYNKNPDYTGTYDDTNMTVFDDGIIFNATLVHGNKTIFSNHEIYISPLLNDLDLCKNNSYNLTQKVFIYDITANYIYYGYVGDNLSIHNITIESIETDCVTLGRQTMHDFIMGKYGFSISFPAEWEFPPIDGGEEIYTIIAVALICLGVPIWLLGGKKYNKVGILMIVVGACIIIVIYAIPAIVDFFTFW